MNEIEIKKLKTLVLQSEDLREPFYYFSSLVKADKVYTMEGHAAIDDDRPESLAIIKVIKDKIKNHLDIILSELVSKFYEIPEYHFIHGGSCGTDKKIFVPTTVFYFSDIHTGVFATVPKPEQVELFRFTFDDGI